LIFHDHEPLESVEISANRIITDGGISRAGIGRNRGCCRGRRFVASQRSKQPTDLCRIPAHSVDPADIGTANFIDVTANRAERLGRRLGPSSTRDGSMSATLRACSSTSSMTTLAANVWAVAVFPQAFGPSITTAPEDANRSRSSDSTTRGR
jgi:hypothetical protein